MPFFENIIWALAGLALFFYGARTFKLHWHNLISSLSPTIFSLMASPRLISSWLAGLVTFFFHPTHRQHLFLTLALLYTHASTPFRLLFFYMGGRLLSPLIYAFLLFLPYSFSVHKNIFYLIAGLGLLAYLFFQNIPAIYSQSFISSRRLTSFQARLDSSVLSRTDRTLSFFFQNLYWIGQIGILIFALALVHFGLFVEASKLPLWVKVYVPKQYLVSILAVLSILIPSSWLTAILSVACLRYFLISPEAVIFLFIFQQLAILALETSFSHKQPSFKNLQVDTRFLLSLCLTGFLSGISLLPFFSPHLNLLPEAFSHATGQAKILFFIFLYPFLQTIYLLLFQRSLSSLRQFDPKDRQKISIRLPSLNRSIVVFDLLILEMKKLFSSLETTLNFLQDFLEAKSSKGSDADTLQEKKNQFYKHLEVCRRVHWEFSYCTRRFLTTSSCRTKDLEISNILSHQIYDFSQDCHKMLTDIEDEKVLPEELLILHRRFLHLYEGISQQILQNKSIEKIQTKESYIQGRSFQSKISPYFYYLNLIKLIGMARRIHR